MFGWLPRPVGRGIWGGLDQNRVANGKRNSQKHQHGGNGMGVAGMESRPGLELPVGCLTSRSSPTCTVRISPVCSSMLKNSGLPCSRMENRSAALSVSGSSASVASALVTKVPGKDREEWGQCL